MRGILTVCWSRIELTRGLYAANRTKVRGTEGRDRRRTPFAIEIRSR